MNIQLSRVHITKVVSFFVVVYPIIFRYTTFIPQVMFGELIGFAMLIVCFLNGRGKLRIELSILLFAICFLARSIISIFEGGDQVSNAVGTGLRLTLLYVFIMCFLPYFDYKAAKKYIDLITVMIVCYEILQLVFARKNIFLTTSLPLLNPLRETDNEIAIKAMYGIRFRPCAVFGEPGELGAFLALPLALNLFGKEKDGNWIIKSAICTVGMIGTFSSTGIVMAIVIWTIFIVKYNTLAKSLLLIAVGGVGGGALMIKMGVWNYFIERTFGNRGVLGIVSSTHFRDIPHVFEESRNFKNFFIGAGMVDPDGFLSGLPRLYFWLGIVGTIVFLCLMVYAFRCGNSMQRSLIFVWIILNVAGSYLIGAFSLPYMIFMISNDCRSLECPDCMVELKPSCIYHRKRMIT